MAVEHEQRRMADFVWLPDDTEESVAGSGLHQQAIMTAYGMLLQIQADEHASWGVGNQLSVEGFRRRDGSLFTPMPDVVVVPRHIPLELATISIAEYGIPWLFVEVASPSTWSADVGEKAATYARAGVAEYLVFDPTGALLGTQVWAQRVTPAGVVPWLPEAGGRWHSERLGLSFQPNGVLLTVYDRHGIPIATYSEERQRRLAEEQLRLDAERQRQEAEQARLEAERRLAALEAELRRLRGEGT